MKSFTRWKSLLLASLLLLVASTISVSAQTTSFTYQGRLTDTAPQGGAYLLRFELYDALTGGTLIDTLMDIPATVTNGVFTVELNFTAPNAFDGTDRFLQISIRRNAAESYVTLNPRQKLTSTPYAVRALTATNALQIGGTPESQIIREGDTRLSDTRVPTPGSNDYIQNQTATTQASTNFNISGTGTANVFNAATQFNIGGQRVLSIPGNSNLYVGASAGIAPNNTGQVNSFFGAYSGYSNTSGNANSFFGVQTGQNNTTGSDNSVFGLTAGLFNTTGGLNSFFGRGAGQNNTTGGNNSFFGSLAGINNISGGRNTAIGYLAGTVNKTGSNNTAIGSSANFGSDNLNFATAIGAGTIVSSSNTIVLGRGDGSDTVQIPGNLNITGSFGANIFNAATQFNIGGNRVLSIAGQDNFFAGIGAGAANTTGIHNTFVGKGAGILNDASFNAFFGRDAGRANTTGSANTFFGASAGVNNTTGNRNIFIGTDVAVTNVTGSSNTIIGTSANVTSDNLTFATALGANATVSTSNTIVLGRSSGQDTVQIPGNLNVTGNTTFSGTASVGGDIYVSTPGAGLILRALNGSCFRLIVANNGALSTTSVTCPQ